MNLVLFGGENIFFYEGFSLIGFDGIVFWKYIMVILNLMVIFMCVGVDGGVMFVWFG